MCGYAVVRLCARGGGQGRSPLGRHARRGLRWDGAGPAPRGRGKRREPVPSFLDARLIPARAGKTSCPSKPYAPSAAHPRACGENARVVHRPGRGCGSSPRVRGKRRAGRVGARCRGLIPARAGKTPTTSRPAFPRQAHPRACGENSKNVANAAASCGSSPRVRGKPSHVRVPPRGTGLIPARAGKTFFTDAEDGVAGAHPRACGENVTITEPTVGPVGSSPRVRGKRGRREGPGRPRGLIPARAGKTRGEGVPKRMHRAHPRACGENCRPRGCRPPRGGSSPRVRGKHFLTWAFIAQAGRILETLEPYAFSESYSFPGARANGGWRRARLRDPCTGPALGRPLGAS